MAKIIFLVDKFMLANTKKYHNNTLVSENRPVLDGFLPLQERDGANAVLSEYSWGLNLGGGIGGLLDLKQGAQNYAYLYDGKGNVTALLNGSQTVVVAYTYDAFGNLMSETGSLSQPFQFSTKPYDEETGLSYFGCRFYSPVTGRWMTRDPIGYVGGMNLYAYVGNDPVNWVDPYGLTPEDRVHWAVDQYLHHKGDWKGLILSQNRCNEFVAAAHIFGDPDVVMYPRVLREDRYGLPTVEDLSKPDFFRNLLDYFPYAPETAQPGDIIIWYDSGKGIHHSGIYIGNNQVIYQYADRGVKTNYVSDITEYWDVDPIVRRYVYPPKD